MDVLVYIECADGKAVGGSFEALSAGASTGASVNAVLIGSGLDDAAAGRARDGVHGAEAAQGPFCPRAAQDAARRRRAAGLADGHFGMVVFADCAAVCIRADMARHVLAAVGQCAKQHRRGIACIEWVHYRHNPRPSPT